MWEDKQMHQSALSLAQNGQIHLVATMCTCQCSIKMIQTSVKPTAMFQSLITNYPRTSR